MQKLLHIVASPREEKSRTLEVSRLFLNAFKEKQPLCSIDTLNLFEEKLPSLNMKRVDSKYMLLAGKDLYGEAKDSWDEILKQINRFLAADIYLISVPMWNFHIPYPLKHYIDVIVQPKYLFQYTDQGVEGLAKNKKMVIVSSRGGDYSASGNPQLDLETPYLKTVFGFIGITDMHFISAEPMDMGKKMREEKLKIAEGIAQEIAKQL